jgi:(E)-4-hydroxy-3-methylbut-2-enyl-diphosphate synthase
MSTTYTRDVQAAVAQIHQLEEVGCELVRVACPEAVYVQALGARRRQIHLPLIADIHYSGKLALLAIEQGVDAVRINPGNLLGGREMFTSLATAARDAGITMRIGVKSGSTDALEHGRRARKVSMKRRDDGTVLRSASAEERRRKREQLVKRMVVRALEYCGWTKDPGFFAYKGSLKSSNVLTAVAAYRQFAAACDVPLHPGITEAGTLLNGAVKSAVGCSQLPGDGIGDTIRVSLTAEPGEEIPVAYEILRAVELRVTFVSCPSCGRAEIGVLTIAREVEKCLYKGQTPIQVAVMGCVVNGPGESRNANVGLAGGRGKGVIYRKGPVVKTVPESDFLEEVLKEIAHLLPPHEARLRYPGDGSPGSVSLGRTRKSGWPGVPLPLLSQREVS